ncbi:MAG TPA: response regulator [Candidatus Acidoferrum sp.]|nr:response regulator [Candidatus Acidoferrum sp.]
MKKRVLIVDDDVGVRTSMKRVLERAGYQVALAEDGPQAMAQFAPDQTDLMLLDLNLPLKSGWDVFEHLTTRNPLVPVIIITGMAGQHRTALAAGVGALIEKPVEPAGLLRTIGEVLAEADEMRLRRLCGLEGATRHVRSRHPQSPAVPHAP